MAELEIRAQALRDIRRIAVTGQRDFGAAASRRYLAGFERLFELLRAQPLAGQERPELGNGVRSLSHRPYRVLYRVVGDTVLVVRVLHQARDASRALRSEQ